MTDPIADMLTRIRNGLRNGVKTVTMPSSKMKISVLQVLQREGFILRFEIAQKAAQNDLVVYLKYGAEGESVARSVRRVSTPGRRVYAGATDVKPVLGGMGIKVLSTSKGVMSDREAREANVGGEVICELW